MRLPIKAGVGVQAGSVVVHIAPSSTFGPAVALTSSHRAHVAVALAALQLAWVCAGLPSQPIRVISFVGTGRLQPAVVRRNMKGPRSTLWILGTLAGTVTWSGTLDHSIWHIVPCSQVALLGTSTACTFPSSTTTTSSRLQASMSASSVPLGKVRVGAGGPGDRGSGRIARVRLAAVAHDPGSFATSEVGPWSTIASVDLVEVMTHSKVMPKLVRQGLCGHQFRVPPRDVLVDVDLHPRPNVAR